MAEMKMSEVRSFMQLLTNMRAQSNAVDDGTMIIVPARDGAVLMVGIRRDGDWMISAIESTEAPGWAKT
jgi:hypothetical protein